VSAHRDNSRLPRSTDSAGITCSPGDSSRPSPADARCSPSEATPTASSAQPSAPALAANSHALLGHIPPTRVGHLRLQRSPWTRRRRLLWNGRECVHVELHAVHRNRARGDRQRHGLDGIGERDTFDLGRCRYQRRKRPRPWDDQPDDRHSQPGRRATDRRERLDSCLACWRAGVEDLPRADSAVSATVVVRFLRPATGGRYDTLGPPRTPATHKRDRANPRTALVDVEDRAALRDLGGGSPTQPLRNSGVSSPASPHVRTCRPMGTSITRWHTPISYQLREQDTGMHSSCAGTYQQHSRRCGMRSESNRPRGAIHASALSS
jgi:hypothetical protein